MLFNRNKIVHLNGKTNKVLLIPDEVKREVDGIVEHFHRDNSAREVRLFGLPPLLVLIK